MLLTPEWTPEVSSVNSKNAELFRPRVFSEFQCSTRTSYSPRIFVQKSDFAFIWHPYTFYWLGQDSFQRRWPTGNLLYKLFKPKKRECGHNAAFFTTFFKSTDELSSWIIWPGPRELSFFSFHCEHDQQIFSSSSAF